MPVSKKIFFTSSILLIITLLLWGVYHFSFKKPEKQIAEITENLKEKKDSFFGTTENSDDGTIVAVSEDSVLSPVYLSGDRVIKYYSKLDGRAYQIDSDGKNKRTVSSREFPGLVSALWSPDGSRAILKTKEGGANNFYYYDYTGSREIKLKENLDAVTWANDSRIFYRYYDPVSREVSLNIADPDGSNWKKILDTDTKDIFIQPVPETGLVSFWNKPDSQTETFFRSFYLLGGESHLIFSEKFGADYLWNKDGTKVLVSHADREGGSRVGLAIIDSRGDSYKNLEIPTLVSKAAWSRDNSTVYYALPGSMPEAAVMPNDYENGRFSTSDTFWKVDVATGKKSRIVELNKILSKFDVTDMFFNYDESVLYFINKLDEKLYRINL